MSQYHEQITAQALEIERLTGEVALLKQEIERLRRWQTGEAPRTHYERYLHDRYGSTLENQNKTDTDGSGEGETARRDHARDAKGPF